MMAKILARVFCHNNTTISFFSISFVLLDVCFTQHSAPLCLERVSWENMRAGIQEDIIHEYRRFIVHEGTSVNVYHYSGNDIARAGPGSGGKCRS